MTELLESELQSQLHGAAAARTDDGVGCGHVGRGASTTEGPHGRIVQTESVLSAVGIGKVRMIENVKKLGAELSVDALSEMPVLGHREIEVSEAGVGKRVARHVAELARAVEEA